MLWTGDRVHPEEYDRLPREERMKGFRDVEWKKESKPLDILKGTPVCVEIHENSIPLTVFEHPKDAVYVFGPEDGGVPQVIRQHCHWFVHIPAFHCLNLAAALNVVLYDRATKNGFSTSVGTYEKRGEIDLPGWEGK